MIDNYISELENRLQKNELNSVVAIYNLIMLSDEKENTKNMYTEIFKYLNMKNL